MFGGTYRCEQLLTLMKRNKYLVRSRINGAHLASVLKVIITSNISFELGIIAEKSCQVPGRKY